MRYAQLEAAVLQLVAEASEVNLRTFGAETVVRLVNDEVLLDSAAEHELDAGAWAALTFARDNVLTASAAELRAQLVRIDEGVLTDGDMDTGLLTVISALEHWTTYLEEDRREAVYELAIRAIEQVDFQFPSELDDFLAKPEIAAEYERIRRLLTG